MSCLAKNNSSNSSKSADLDGGAGGLLGHRNTDHHPDGEELDRERGLDLDVAFDARAAVLLDDGQHPEGQVDALRDAVLHQLELAVGGHERHAPVRVEPAQVHALVEGHVVQLDQLAAGLVRLKTAKNTE